MRILITGAAGFLGSHLCDRLLSEGHEVIGLDNFVTGNPGNISHLMGHKKFSFFKHDVSNYIFMPGKVDAVLHFASPASPNPQSPSGYFNLPIQTMKAGALGTHNCLGVARANKARFLLASTSEIYGDPLVHPQTENYPGNVDPVGPRAVYDEAKRFAESLTMAYHRAHDVDTRIVRIFNTYGPRMDLEDGRALPNLLKQALLGQPLTVYGDGSQTRSFCYVDDLIDGIIKLLYSEEISVVTHGEGARHVPALLRALTVPDVPTAVLAVGAIDAPAIAGLDLDADRIVVDTGYLVSGRELCSSRRVCGCARRGGATRNDGR